MELRESLVSDRFVRVKHDENNPTTFEHMRAMLECLDWSQVWHDADLKHVCCYLRGSRSLRLPDWLRELLPLQI